PDEKSAATDFAFLCKQFLAAKGARKNKFPSATYQVIDKHFDMAVKAMPDDMLKFFIDGIVIAGDKMFSDHQNRTIRVVTAAGPRAKAALPALEIIAAGGSEPAVGRAKKAIAAIKGERADK